MNKLLDNIIKIRKPRPEYKILSEIGNRFSPRHYKNQQIPPKDIKTIFEAARWAPSGHNDQPWTFFYTDKKSKNYTKPKS